MGGGPRDRGVLEASREELFREERLIVAIIVAKNSNIGWRNQDCHWVTEI